MEKSGKLVWYVNSRSNASVIQCVLCSYSINWGKMFMFSMKYVVSCLLLNVHRCTWTCNQAAASFADSHQAAGSYCSESYRLPYLFSYWPSDKCGGFFCCCFFRTKPKLSHRKSRSFLRSTTKWYRTQNRMNFDIFITTKHGAKAIKNTLTFTSLFHDVVGKKGRIRITVKKYTNTVNFILTTIFLCYNWFLKEIGVSLLDVPALQAVHPVGRDPEEDGGGQRNPTCGVAALKKAERTTTTLMMKNTALRWELLNRRFTLCS